MTLTYIIKRPLITEQSLQDASKGIFTFEVSRSATKGQIKEAVEQFFGVTVEGVRTTTIASKPYSTRLRRRQLHTPVSKKAKVQLKKGQKIDLFDVEEAK